MGATVFNKQGGRRSEQCQVLLLLKNSTSCRKIHCVNRNETGQPASYVDFVCVSEQPCIIEQKQSNAARTSREFVHRSSTEWTASSRCAHTTAAVVDPELDDLVGEPGLPCWLLPAAARAASGAAWSAAVAVVVAVAAVAVGNIGTRCFCSASSAVFLLTL